MRNLLTKRWLRLVVLLVVVGWLLAWGAARVLIVRAPLERADALMVLSGSSRLVERNHFAAQLFREGRAPRIILTNDNQQMGWDTRQQRNPFSYEWAQKILQVDGVPADRIEVVMQPVYGTHNELEVVREYAHQHKLQSLLIVTSAYHSRRTLWTANNVFKDTGLVIGLEHPRPGVPAPWNWFLRRSGWRLVAGEYLKLVYYQLHF